MREQARVALEGRQIQRLVGLVGPGVEEGVHRGWRGVGVGAGTRQLSGGDPHPGLYHALERLHALCDGLYGADRSPAERMADQWTAMLKNDQVGEVVAAARRRLAELVPQPGNGLEKQIAFFENHQDKMRYQTYRNQGLFYGSGVVEGGCRSVIG